MVYLLKTELEKNQQLLFALKSIYGIGHAQSFILCKKLGISKNYKVHELLVEQTNELCKILSGSGQNFTSNLKKLHILTFKKLISIKTYRGLRRLKGLPARGQRTHTNAKTAKRIK
uniref:ribosomal protein S13 n=1 Tax=Odontella aurita TaxID=265563 RepID=UPI00202811B3|nr:ribosomal protein S13 [Odontella aurita]QYB22941.1 ribosomal protein S13 [Odontella aurita]